ncbi:hypothetical protein [Phenylobacterium sp. Root700]|uniref:hypothetical protein n=1 Tax=Phenylobacterium sp. Root700 TaxID=1736591 RepID=UPI0006F5FE7F|nr:hypothetical protein [Phenylobacterium sp. Root700]KRB46556.1 hypothetical protein ASE02_18930 [Phenylobacterium sp. Root700]
MSPAKRATAPVRTFRASLRGGVWEVTRDYVFYGDYLTREEAIDGACKAARSVEASGGSARVMATPSDTLIAHQIPRFKP